MSLWDFLIIALLFVAIFRGYIKGLCRRFTEWVGLVIAFILAKVTTSSLDGILSTTFGVKGRETIEEWLVDYFETRIPASPQNQLENLKEWANGLSLPSSLKENLYKTIDHSSSDIYSSIYAQVAHNMANPAWEWILTILGTMIFFAVLILVGELLGPLLRRFHVMTVIDGFLGALVSGFLVMVVAGVFTALLVFIVPQTAGYLGSILHGSFIAPILEQALDGLLKGGLFF